MLGFINVYKPSGLSSSAVVVKLKKQFHIDKIGHMGTLDPLASGVLPIAIGKATRMFNYFLEKNKTYVATFEFGFQTNTLDLDGEVVKTSDCIPTKSEIVKKLRQFIGYISQIPPDFSAKSVNGVRSYNLARAGQQVELKPQKVCIERFELLSCNDKQYTFEITCSSGTYIRALGRDLAESLNSVCTMVKLERIESGVFNIKNATTMDDILKSNNLDQFLMDVTDVFPKIPIIEINDFLYNRIRNGLTIHNIYSIETITFVRYQNRIIGVAKNINDELKLKTFLLED